MAAALHLSQFGEIDVRAGQGLRDQLVELSVCRDLVEVGIYGHVHTPGFADGTLTGVRMP